MFFSKLSNWSIHFFLHYQNTLNEKENRQAFSILSAKSHLFYKALQKLISITLTKKKENRARTEKKNPIE